MTARTPRLNVLLNRTLLLLVVLFTVAAFQQTVAASPFGQGLFGADVPFGANTSLSINLSGNVDLTLASSGPNFAATSSNSVTVTSTDVEGYDLYIYSAANSDLSNGSDTLAASGNSVASSLATNTWGYNLDGSANYVGTLTTPKLLLSATGPYKTGNTTNIHYGVLADATKPAGVYTGNVTYTVVAKNQ
ncbi:MAG: hypothetical protein ABI221_00695 [Candidatus Saccharimonadales bacterium]